MIANGAEEARKPRRDIPLATGLCLGLCTALYAAASTVIVGEQCMQDNVSAMFQQLLHAGQSCCLAVH